MAETRLQAKPRRPVVPSCRPSPPLPFRRPVLVRSIPGNSEVVFVDQTTTGSPGNQMLPIGFGPQRPVALMWSSPYPISTSQLTTSRTRCRNGGCRAPIPGGGASRHRAPPLARWGRAARCGGRWERGPAQLLGFSTCRHNEWPDLHQPVQAGNTARILEINDAPLSCADEAGGNALRLCHDGDQAYRMVAYPGSPDSTELAVVFGASDGLVPLD